MIIRLVQIRSGFVTLLLPLLGLLSVGSRTAEVTDEASIRVSLTAGGSIVFGRDITITQSAPFIIERDVSFDARGHQVILSGGGSVRLFEVRSGVRLELNGIILSEGRHRGTDATSNDPSTAGLGGAIYCAGGQLSMSNCTLRGHTVIGGNGTVGATLSAVGAGSEASGGAIFVADGTLRAVHCSFEGNRAIGGNGGCIYPSLPINCFSAPGGEGRGGAITAINSKIEISHSRFIDGQVVGGGTTGRTVSSGGVARGGFCHLESSSGSFEQCIFLNGQASAGPNSDIGSAPAGDQGGHARGGAIHLSTSDFKLERCLFRSNGVVGGFAISRDGSWWGGDGLGGAVYQTTGHLALARCAIVENFAIGADNIFSTTGHDGQGFGGGIFVQAGQFEAVNCLIAGNLASTGKRNSFPPVLAQGGGIYFGVSTGLLHHCTFLDNRVYALDARASLPPRPATWNGAALFVSTNAVVSAYASIFSGNTNFVPLALQIDGPMLDLDYNLSSDASPSVQSPTSRAQTDPGFSILSLGPEEFPKAVFGSNSPAVDAAPLDGGPAVDLDGQERPIGVLADIGAYEYTPTANLRIDGDGKFVVRLTVQPSRTFRIETSRDLIEWTAAGTAISTDMGILDFALPAPHDTAQSFVRFLPSN